MMLDNETLFSENQAVTASANSTDVFDSGANGSRLGAGEPLCFGTLVTANFATLTSLTIQFVGADDAALTTNVEILDQSEAVLLADLTAGERVFAGKLNLTKNKKRYYGFKYVVGGSNATAGTVTSYVDLQQNEHQYYPNAYDVQTN